MSVIIHSNKVFSAVCQCTDCVCCKPTDSFLFFFHNFFMMHSGKGWNGSIQFFSLCSWRVYACMHACAFGPNSCDILFHFSAYYYQRLLATCMKVFMPRFELPCRPFSLSSPEIGSDFHSNISQQNPWKINIGMSVWMKQKRKFARHSNSNHVGRTWTENVLYENDQMYEGNCKLK